MLDLELKIATMDGYHVLNINPGFESYLDIKLDIANFKKRMSVLRTQYAEHLLDEPGKLNGLNILFEYYSILTQLSKLSTH